MALATYDELLDAVPNWLWRAGDTALVAAMPDIIALTEDLIAFGDDVLPPLRLREMETSDDITLTDGAGPLPADYLEYREVNYGSNNGVLLSSDFTIVGDEIRTTRTGVSPLAFNYYAKVPALGPSNQTNWLIDKNKWVYLYGCLISAAPFMKNDARMATWRTMYVAAITGLNNTDMRSRYARGSVRTAGTTP